MREGFCTDLTDRKGTQVIQVGFMAFVLSSLFYYFYCFKDFLCDIRRSYNKLFDICIIACT
jgi:hypothetical protein